MNRISVTLENDVYLYIQNVSKNNHKYRNASHFVEYCIRSVMDKKE